MTPEQITETLTSAASNHDVLVVADALKHNVQVFEQKFPTLAPLEIGTGLLVGVAAYLNAKGVADQDIAQVLQQMSQALGKIAARKAT